MKFIFYLPVILAIALTKFFHVGYGLVVFLQVALGALSLWLFYNALGLITTKKYTLLGTLVLLFCFPLQKWNFYLYSDSFFYSLTTIFFSGCIIYYKQTQFSKLFWLLLFFPIILIFARPSGMFFLPATSLGILLLFRKKVPLAVLLISSVLPIILLVTTIRTAFQLPSDYDAFTPFVEEHIICLVPATKRATNLDIQTTGNMLTKIGYYIVHNPLHFTTLLLKRLFSFLIPYRSHYSTLHNLFLCSYFAFIYVLFFSGIRSFYRIHKKLFMVLITAILLYTGATIFQCDDWSNRFTMTLVSLCLFIGCHRRQEQKWV
jgi:hypothetical protein